MSRLGGGPGERASLPRRSRRIAGSVPAIGMAAALACGRAGPDGSTAGLRIVGEVERSVEEPLWAPVDLAVSGDRVWVVDAGAAVVHAYDREGRRRGTIGRKGRGPGELLDPLAIGVSGDSLWVLNTGNRRIEWFGLDGTARESIPVADSVPPLVDLVRHRERWYGTSPFGRAPVLRLVVRRGALVVDGAFGDELEERARRERGDVIQSVYRLEVARDRVWALHAYLPLAASFDRRGAARDLVDYPADAVGKGGIEERRAGDRTRRIRSAPENPVGGLGLLEADGDLLLLTRQRTAEGRQRMFELDGASVVRPRHGPPGVLLLAAEPAGPRIFAVATQGELDEPAVLILEPRDEEER